MLTQLFLVCLVFETITAQKCDSFENVPVLTNSKDKKQRTYNVNGCIERTSFDDYIVSTEIQNHTIPRLGRDSIRHMVNLHTVIFQRSGIQELEAAAFRNVPKLETVKILDGDLEAIPSAVFNTERTPKLEHLYLTGNKIARIADDAFSVPTLKTLYCDHNQLTEWKKKWLTQATSLTTMNFGYNKIRVIPRAAFVSFPNIKVINFNFNDLEVIEFDAFKGLTYLDYLGLKHNRLTSLHPRIFPNALTVKSLALNANFLNFIPKNIMVSVTVKRTSIDGNPWKCPCLHQLTFWLYDTNATIEQTLDCAEPDVPVCFSPSAFSRACRETVEEDVTRRYLEGLRNIEPPLDNRCARLD